MKPRFAPFWYDRFPERRRPAFPRQRAQLDTRVVVIGGGLTGCACACALAAARIPVVVLEADRVGAGVTAGAIGLVREDFDASFEATVSAYGLRAARMMWQSMHRAALDFPAALRRLGIKCDLAQQDLLTVASPDRVAVRQIRREYDLRRQAGLDHRWMTATNIAREAGLESGGGIKTIAATLDPYRACLGLASAAVDRGAQLFERSAARRIRAGRKFVEVHTSNGTVKAETVLVATAAPLKDLRALRRHLHPRHGYAVMTEQLPAAVRRAVGRRQSVMRDIAMPPHFVRWLKDDRVLIAGADQDPTPARNHKQVMVQRTGQLMYELSLLYPAISGTSPAWGWSYAFDETVDALPYIGTHRNFPRHFFALGMARHGLAVAWLTARLLLRHVTEEQAKGDDLFGFSRILSGH